MNDIGEPSVKPGKSGIQRSFGRVGQVVAKTPRLYRSPDHRKGSAGGTSVHWTVTKPPGKSRKDFGKLVC